MFETEHEFSLPKGYVDAQGALHRGGLMRCATRKGGAGARPR